MRARGACPGIAQPMQTGDGLLARSVPRGPIRIAAMLELCDAAEEHGNGIIEVTQRGSFQFRGLRPESASEFARVVTALDLGTTPGPTILASPLIGFDPWEP